MSAWMRQVLCLALLFTIPTFLHGGMIVYEFNEQVLPSGLTSAIDSGYSIDFTTNVGYAVFSAQAGTGGSARLVTSQSYTGDFIILTVARRDVLASSALLGMAIYLEWPPDGDSPFASLQDVVSHRAKREPHHDKVRGRRRLSGICEFHYGAGIPTAGLRLSRVARVVLGPEFRGRIERGL